MSIQKITIDSYLLLIMNFFLFACGDHMLESPTVINPSQLNSDNYFEAIIDIYDSNIDALEFIPEQILGVEYKGNGHSNMLGQVSLTSYHQERLVSHYLAPRVEFGKFSLTSESHKDALTGTYTGSGSSWKLNIQGGSGKFIETRGSLNMRIEDNGSQGITALISGFVDQ